MKIGANETIDLLNLTHDSILVRDLDDRILFWNRGAEQIYGWREEEALGKVTHELLQTQFPKPLAEIKREVVRLGYWNGELIHSTRDGRRIVVMSRWALKRDQYGQPEATVEANDDITERKRSEEELRKATAELEVRVERRTAALANEITERRRGEEAIEAKVRQQQVVVELGQQALAGIDPSTLMNLACTLVAQTLGVEFCKILELLPDDKALLLRAGVGWQNGLVGSAIVPAGINSQAGYTLLFSKPVIVEDLRTETRFRGPALLHDHGVVSGMSAIIAGRDRPFGILGAHTARQRIFKADDAHFLEAVAIVLSEAIQRKKAEEEIRRGANWLERLIEATQDAVLSIDRQGRIVLFNPAAERIFGYMRAEVEGRKVNMLMAEPYATEHDGYIARYERTGEARAIGRIRTVTAKRKNGELFPIELSVTKVSDKDNVQYAAFIRDTSEKMRLQEQLVESERLAAIGSTAAKIGHELGNPLNGMSLTIQLLERRLRQLPDTVMDGQIGLTVNRLKNEISRLTTLLEHFRSLARREKFNFQPTTLTALVGEAIEIDLPRYAEQGVQVECSFAADLPSVIVDIDKMKQVVLNLTKNAAEAIAGGGKISIRGFAAEDKIMLEVSDTGTGIPPGIDIFQPFFTTKPEGTGIGLAVVQQIISSHGGSITYHSEHGKGTTFVIALPRN
jgi:PAS domain S-box-containing protein